MIEKNLVEKEDWDEYDWTKDRGATWWLMPTVAIALMVAFSWYYWPIVRVVHVPPAVRVPK